MPTDFEAERKKLGQRVYRIAANLRAVRLDLQGVYNDAVQLKACEARELGGADDRTSDFTQMSLQKDLISVLQRLDQLAAKYGYFDVVKEP